MTSKPCIKFYKINKLPLTRFFYQENHKKKIYLNIIRLLLLTLKFLLLFIQNTDAANCDNIKCKDRQKCLIDFVTHRPRCLSCNFNCPHTKRPQVNSVLSYYYYSIRIVIMIFVRWNVTVENENSIEHAFVNAIVRIRILLRI